MKHSLFVLIIFLQIVEGSNIFLQDFIIKIFMYFCIPIVQYFFMMDTREFIIDEAYKLFLNQSYEAVSISVISEAIGFTKGALYHHFKNKEELFKAVINKHFNIQGIVVDVDHITLKEYTEASIEHARTILMKIFQKSENFIPINYLSLIADSFRHYEGFAREKLNFLDQEVATVETIISNAIERGEIRSDINIHIVALQYFSLSVGLAGDIMRNNSIESAVGSMRDMLNQLYHLLKI